MVIILEGLAGSGKTSTAHKLAEQLGYIYLDSGKLYRLFAKHIISKNIPLVPKQIYISLLEFLEISRNLKDTNDVMSVELNSPEISNVTSYIGSAYFVRKRINQLLLRYIQEAKNNIILTGRNLQQELLLEDASTIYLSVSLEERAKRRWLERETHNPDINPSLAETISEMRSRDERDTGRMVSPFVVTQNAIWVDAEMITIEQAVLEIMVRLNLEGATRQEFGSSNMKER